MNMYSDNKELFEYYDERASEYEEFYWGGVGSRLHNPELYTHETLRIRQLLPELVSGKCLDIACGTAFWLPVYEKNCTHITLIDQSENVLVECKGKVDLLGIRDKVEIIQDNIFEHDFPKNAFDIVVAGFLISHLEDSQITEFYYLVDKLLISGGRLLIIDSCWSEETARSGKPKSGTVKRKLNDGREFEVYKRYFESDDISEINRKFGTSTEIIFFGQLFFLVSAAFS